MSVNVLSPISLSAEQRGIVSMLGAMACFSAHDALCRIASQQVPVSQILFVRGLFGIALLASLAVALRVKLRHRSLVDRWVWLRATLDVLGSASYVYALKHLELANVTAIAMSAPVLLTLFAALFLRETIGKARWCSVVGGLVGVMLVVQPASGNFNGWSLLALASAMLMASRDMLTRVIGGGVPSLMLSMTSVVATTVMGGIWGRVDVWPPLVTPHIVLLVLASIAMCAGYLLSIIAMRAGALATVAPFRYSALIFSAVIGYVVWRYVPNALAWAGIALILLSGMVAHFSVAGRPKRGNSA